MMMIIESAMQTASPNTLIAERSDDEVTPDCCFDIIAET